MRTVALIYHDVAAPGARASGRSEPSAGRYTLPLALFEQHLEAIAAAGASPALPGESPVVLTFDDGGASAAATIAPALERRGWLGCFFVTTAAIGTPGFVTEDDVRRLRSVGHLVGSHSHTHPFLTRLSDAEVADEWTRSKTILEEILGAPVDTLSVPTGYYDERVGRLAAEAGYRRIFTSEPWLEPRPLGAALVHGRFSVVNTTPAAHVERLCRLSPRALWPDAAGWYARKAAKRALGPVYTRVRARLLRE